MFQTIPCTISTKHIFVLLVKCSGIDVIEIFKRTGGHRERIHTSLLKKPQTLSSSGSLLPKLLLVGRNCFHFVCQSIVCDELTISPCGLLSENPSQMWPEGILLIQSWNLLILSHPLFRQDGCVSLMRSFPLILSQND